MIKRIVEISSPARLSLKNRQMVVERDGSEAVTVPVEDIGVLILDHPAISHTQGLLAACFGNNVAVVVCCGKHLPGALLMPLEGNSLHSRTVSEQARMSEPTRKRLWQRIVQAKIQGQAKTLSIVNGESGPLKSFAERVRSGDPDNIEAQAARIYWQRLFGDAFRRDAEAPGINSLLNYGYMVMRAAVARAVVGAGLHPSLGVHHHNQYNSFCLADDLVEPLRPAVDLKVHAMSRTPPLSMEFTPDLKREILGVLGISCVMGGQSLPLMEVLHRYAAEVRDVICGDKKEMEIPEP